VQTVAPAPASPQYSIQPKVREGPKVAEINRLYGKYSPEKLADVPGLVQKYGEDQLLAMVMKKYREQEVAAAAGPQEPDSPGYFPTSPKVAQVQRLYGKYNPKKLADVPGLVEKYGEDKLLAMVMKKYKEQEEAAAAGAAFTKAAVSLQAVRQIQPQQKEQVSPKVAEVKRLYGKYNPEKLGDVPTLLAKYGEDKLCAMVRKKYEAQEDGFDDGGHSPAPAPVKRVVSEADQMYVLQLQLDEEMELPVWARPGRLSTLSVS
jgi:hypothetical protein